MTFDPPWLRPIDDREAALRALLQTANRCSRTEAEVNNLASMLHRSCVCAVASVNFGREIQAATGGRRVRQRVNAEQVATAEAAKAAMQDRLIADMPLAVRSVKPPSPTDARQGEATPTPQVAPEREAAAVARWRSFMEANGHMPEPEPNAHSGRTPNRLALLLLEEIATVYIRLTRGTAGRTTRLKAGEQTYVPSPFERFAMAVLRLYGLPSGYKVAGAWITPARTLELQRRRTARKEI